MNNGSVPVFVVCYNRLASLKVLVDRLEEMGFTDIHLIDNNSSYPPLLEYLKNSKHTVHRMQENFGHLVLWKSGRFDEIINSRKYILTDCDVVPSEDCPTDIVERLNEILERYPPFTKAGLSIRIDDLPDHYAFKQQVIEWEAPFWETRLDDGNYEGAVDTTFALYKPGIHCEDPSWWRSIRSAPPMSARHLPWYQDTSIVTDEDAYYQNSVSSVSSQWSLTSLDSLKRQNTDLQHELARLKAAYRQFDEDMKNNESAFWHLKRTLVLVIKACGLLPLATAIKMKLGARND